MTASPTAQWARFYSKAGFRSFPVWPGEKRPLYSGWQRDATTDPDLIERYFANPANNVGVVCGEMFDAWDIEVEHIPAFMEFVAKQEPQAKCPFGDPHGALPEAPIASTGRGGLHILTAPTGVDGTRRLHLDGVHIGELKSRGGFILVCPSVTEQMYRWTWLPERLAVQPAPEWLLGLLREPRKAYEGPMWPEVSIEPEFDLQPLSGAVRRSRDHDRNNNLHWAANRAVDAGIPQGLAERKLTAAFLQTTHSGESHAEREREALATIASAYRRE